MTKYFALAFYKLYGGARLVQNGVTEYEKKGEVHSIPYYVYRVSRLVPAWAAGQTIGNYVFLREDAPISILDHELVHVEQFARYAPWFPVLYLIAHLRYGYQGNPYEEEARLRGGW